MKATEGAAGRVESRRSAASTSRWYTAVAVVSFVLFSLIAATAFLTVAKEFDEVRGARDAAQRTRDIIDQLHAVLATVQDAETGERGYLLTGRPEFLVPFEAARSSLEPQLASLALGVRDPQSVELVAELRRRALEQLEYLQTAIRLYEGEGRPSAVALERQETGRRQMEGIREVVQALRARQTELLSARTLADARRSERAERVVFALLGAALVLVFIAGGLLLMDVRRRARAELDLQTTYGLLRGTIDSVAQGITVYDPDLQLVAWNRRYVELRGIDASQLFVGASFDHVVAHGATLALDDPASAAADAAEARSHIRQRESFVAERTRPDGVVLQVRGRPMEDGNYVVTYADVTALKRSEQAFREQATRITAILDNVVDAIITINESGSIESWSQGAERLFGYTAEEVVRRHVSMLMPEPHASAHDGYVRQYILTGERRIMGSRRELEARHRDGRLIPVDLGISEMWLGERRLFIGVVRDITERRAVERLKNEFISTVSHELRTPLTSISGSLGLLVAGAAGVLPAKATRLVGIAHQNSERLVRLINDILDMEKAESGRLDLRLEPQPVRKLVEHAIDLNRAFAERFEVRLELDPRSTDDLVLADADRFYQVLTNLLSNAVKFSPPRGTVRIDIACVRDAVKICVHDDGPGIPPAFRARIFSKFAQADASDSRQKGGTGLGLSIARTLVERHGGRIGFTTGESDTGSGRGTTFWVELPLWRPALERSPEPVPQADGPQVLICEDDPDIAAVLSDLLRNEGLCTEAVGSARAAREILEVRSFDLLLVDLNLPDEDGLSLIASLRLHPRTRELPVVIVTARQGSRSDDGRLASLQVADWLQKPVDPTRLLSTIRSTLSRARGRRPRLLHVEDDASLTETVLTLLENEATVIGAASLGEARQRLREGDYSLVILDLGLPDGSGIELLADLQAGGSPTPVVLYSAMEASGDVAAMVSAALVKSRDSLDRLRSTVLTLTAREHSSEEVGT